MAPITWLLLFRCTTANEAICQSSVCTADRRCNRVDNQRRQRLLLYSRTCHFTPLLTEPSFDYLEALYEQTQYEVHYLEAYTATDQKNLPQQLTAATTE